MLSRPLLLSLLVATALVAQEAPILVNPNRPTFATPSLTTQPGVLELEWGLQRVLLRDEGITHGTPTLLKLGLLRDFEVRFSDPGLMRIAPAGASAQHGLGDATVALQWCFTHDGLFGMDHALQVSHKFPTANVEKGLGSGRADDGIALFLSRDYGAFHLDVNLLQSWLGRPLEAGGGRERQPAATASLSLAMDERWSLTCEVYTLAPALGQGRISSNLWCASYKVSPRLVLDAGVDLGHTQAAPRHTVFAGLTCGQGRFRRMQ